MSKLEDEMPVSDVNEDHVIEENIAAAEHNVAVVDPIPPTTCGMM